MNLQQIFAWIVMTGVFFSCSQEEEQVMGYGNFEARELLVSARSSGTLLFLNTLKGTMLTKGDTVGLTDTILFSLQKEQLQAKAEGVRARTAETLVQAQVLETKLANLEKNRDRIARLVEQEAATVRELDQLVTEVDMTRSQIRQIHAARTAIEKELDVLAAQLRITDQQISDCYIINPENGTILETYFEAGEICQAGRPVYKIADLEIMEFKAYLQASALTLIKPGQEVEVLIDDGSGGGIRYTGVVTWIAGEAEFTPRIIQTPEERVNLVYAVKVRVKNDGRIRIGMPGELYLRNETHSISQ